MDTTPIFPPNHKEKKDNPYEWPAVQANRRARIVQRTNHMLRVAVLTLSDINRSST